jgi:hypothetical protein
MPKWLRLSLAVASRGSALRRCRRLESRIGREELGLIPNGVVTRGAPEAFIDSDCSMSRACGAEQRERTGLALAHAGRRSRSSARKHRHP